MPGSVIIMALTLLLIDGKLVLDTGSLVVTENAAECECCEPGTCCGASCDGVLAWENVDANLDGYTLASVYLPNIGADGWEKDNEELLCDSPENVSYLIECLDGVYTLTITYIGSSPMFGSPFVETVPDNWVLTVNSTSVQCDPFEVVFEASIDVNAVSCNGYDITAQPGKLFRLTLSCDV
jgi:hypothetical protein